MFITDFSPIDRDVNFELRIELHKYITTIVLLSSGKQTSKAPIVKTQNSSNRGNSIMNKRRGNHCVGEDCVGPLTDLAGLCAKSNLLVCDLYSWLTSTYLRGNEYMNLNNRFIILFVKALGMAAQSSLNFDSIIGLTVDRH